jgi:hypothetical protein
VGLEFLVSTKKNYSLCYFFKIYIGHIGKKRREYFVLPYRTQFFFNARTPTRK